MGSVVSVPFGHRKVETAYVIETSDTCTYDAAKVKPISRTIDAIPVFDAAQLSFFEWISDYYLSPLGEVIQMGLPSTMKAKSLKVVNPTEAGINALTEDKVAGEQALVLREVTSRPGLTERGLARRLKMEIEPPATKTALSGLVRMGWVAWEQRELKEVRGMVETVRLRCSKEEALLAVPRAGKRMKALIEVAGQGTGWFDVTDLVASQGSTVRDALKRLESAGVVERGERERRDPLDIDTFDGRDTPPTLNADQAEALRQLIAPQTEGAFLLFGVTSSGKTEVFLHAADHALTSGKAVLVLVPEIGLTPQLVGRFKARFGDAVAVLHSGLTGSERLAQWRRIRAKEAMVAVGARSALFAPFESLGLIVVDEEHDDSYKQEEGVRYSARDLAVVLGRRHGCPVVLASATPSLESWHNVKRGLYRCLRLPKRATPRALPSVEFVDLNNIKAEEGEPRPLLAPVVVEALHRTFDKGGKAIVLYNRRGFATMVECESCGGSYECPNCVVTMTLHKGARVMACHYCGYRVPYSSDCPSCNEPGLKEVGKGTERIEEVLCDLFPGVAVERMDADTTASRGSHQRILNRFRSGETRLLIGTQIVAKGHDFPDVHTAVVVSADRSLRLPDFRSAERTYALLVQLAGRAGRGDVEGRVFIQSYRPDHYVLKYHGDVEAFLDRESHLREVLKYPPYTRLVLVRLDGVDRNAVLVASRAMADDLKRFLGRDTSIGILGPAPSALPRLVGRWRFQVIIRAGDIRELRWLLKTAKDDVLMARRKGVRVKVDVDPRSLL